MIKQMNKVAESPKEKQLNINKFVLVLLAGVILAVFINNSLSLYLGPVLAVLFVYLFFSGYSELVTAVIIVANDALGTILMGSVSFPYLLFLLVICKLLSARSFEKRILLFGAISMLFAGQLFLVGFIDARALIYAMIYVVSIASINPGIDSVATKKFFAGVAFAVVLVAVHATVTGGVEFYELYEGSEQIMRKGVLGVGIGNSNYSGFLLNIGLVCLWYFTVDSALFKVLASIPILYSIVLTQSTSALLCFILILLLSILMTKNINKAFLSVIVFLLVVFCLYVVYTNLPSDVHWASLDAYIMRIEEKLFALGEEDYSTVTTFRSELGAEYLNYIFNEQGLLRLFFGGNPLVIDSVSDMSPHNTYITTMLQFGLLGIVILVVSALRRLHLVFVDKEHPYRKPFLILKSMCLFMAFCISLYGDNLWLVWMLSLFLL